MTKQTTTSLLLGLTVSCLYAASAQAIIQPRGQSGLALKTPIIRPHLYRSDMAPFAADAAEMQVDHQTNAVRLLSGKTVFGVNVTDRSANGYETAAVHAVLSNRDIFGVTDNEIRVNHKATLADREDGSVTLQILRNNILVQDAGITLRFKMGHLVQVKNESFSEANIVLPAGIDTSKIATQALGSSGFVKRGSQWRVKPSAAGYDLVQVDEYLVAGLDDAYIVQVDTSSGEVFELRTQNMHMRGKAVANAYPRYYGEALTESVLPFAKPTHISGQTDARGEFQSEDDQTAPELKGFTGQFVAVQNKAGANLASASSKVADQWLLKFDIKANETTPWDNADAAQAMVYLSANKVIATAKQFISPSWFNKALTTNVNHAQHCNAFWDPNGQTLNFFSAGTYMDMTCANSGLIADVIFHEWGHGLDDNTGGIDDHGMSEGFGDAIAMYMNQDYIIGKEFFPEEHKPVRDLSEVKVYPEDVSDDPHVTGQIVAGAWWDLNQGLKAALGATKAHDLMGKFLFKGIYEFPKMSDVYQATLVLDDDDGDLTNGTPNLCIINAAFKKHGLAEADSHCGH